ncbi:hypothetical protein, partial [Vibrio breoganii]
KIASITLGFLIPWVCIYFSFGFSRFYETIYVTFAYPVMYSVSSFHGYSAYIKNLLLTASISLVFFSCYIGCFFIAVRTMINKSRLTYIIFLCGWVVGDLLGVLLGVRLYDHYFILITASLPIALSLCITYFKFSKVTMLFVNRLVRYTLILILIVPTLGYIRLLGDASENNYWEKMTEITEYINENKHERDEIWINEYTPFMLYEIKLKSTSKYMSPINFYDFEYVQNNIQSKVLSDLTSNKPRWIVDRKYDRDGRESSFDLKLREVLRANYEDVYIGRNYIIYELNGTTY